MLGKCDGKYKNPWTSHPAGFYALPGSLSPVQKTEKSGKKRNPSPAFLVWEQLGRDWSSSVTSQLQFSQLKCFLDFMQQWGWDFPMDFGPEKMMLLKGNDA